MRTRFILILASLALVASPILGERSPAADAVAERVMNALGGEQAWNDTRFLTFSFVVADGEQTLARRTHYWDKWEGRHRVEGSTGEGVRYVVIQNLNEKRGRAFLDGRQLAGDELQTWIDRGYAQWINDTYWLLMPYKLRDPGVNLALDRTETMNGRDYDVLALSFESVGLTPGDRYWVWVDRKTGMVDRWAFVLEGQEPPPRPWSWVGWHRVGNIMLASDRIPPEGTRTIGFRDVSAPRAIPDSVFTELDAPEVTSVLVRAVSRDAKIVGSGVGGAEITVADARTGRELARGEQQGGTGDTGRIISTPHPRDGTIYATEDAAGFEAVFLLDSPTWIEVTARGPLGHRQAITESSKRLLVAPGDRIDGEGLLLELHGFIVEVLEQSAGTEQIAVQARVRMTCGCPTEPGGLWDSDEIDIVAQLLDGDRIVSEVPMTYAGTESTFSATLPRHDAASNIRVMASQPDEGNTGMHTVPVRAR
ncbi:MAG: hypothetical protein KY459_08585 [Acidobacteria bacterium]|nr:hypothetical protein [Acidobacteriota bacterium]